MGISCAAGLVLVEKKIEAAPLEQLNFWQQNRVLDLIRPQTKERARLTFYQNGRYQPEIYKQICWMLRDVRDNNKMVSMDINLINLLYAIQQWAKDLGYSNPAVKINSGYRTPSHNATLEGAARRSLHIQGQAADFTVNGVDIGLIKNMAAYFKMGGVGIYKDFVHVDTWKVRYWRG